MKPNINKREIEEWRLLIKMLQRVSAITLKDAKSPATEIQTPGQELFHQIRKWGDMRFLQGRETTFQTIYKTLASKK